jgi:undecaprenyl-diphosphatase
VTGPHDITVFQALVLGTIQGLSEFLPISSSAHLTLAPWILGWEDPGLSFDVALHFGTLLALVSFFWSEWVALAVAFGSALRRRRIETETERRLLWIVIATIPGGIAGLLLQKYAETVFRAPALIATMLIVMGIVLWLVDRGTRQLRELDSLRWTEALAIGLAQVLALIPGVSRSGSTITAARAFRFSRESAAVFSFLLSLPIIAGAVLHEAPKALQENASSLPLVVGVLAAAISGWVAIGVLLRIVARHSYGLFAAYRVVMGLAVLALVAYRA